MPIRIRRDDPAETPPLDEIEQPEIVTDPDVALGQLTMALWLFEESPSEHRAAVAYTWCCRLVDLGAGDVLNGFPASIVAEMGTS